MIKFEYLFRHEAKVLLPNNTYAKNYTRQLRMVMMLMDGKRHHTGKLALDIAILAPMGTHLSMHYIQEVLIHALVKKGIVNQMKDIASLNVSMSYSPNIKKHVVNIEINDIIQEC